WSSVECYSDRESNRPVTLVWITADQTSCESWLKSPGEPKIPALLKATSSRPYREAIDSMRRATADSSVTSTVMGSIRPLASPASFAVSASGSARRPAATTVAPSRAKARVAARPMPDPPPVTRTTFPAKRLIVGSLHLAHGQDL